MTNTFPNTPLDYYDIDLAERVYRNSETRMTDQDWIQHIPEIKECLPTTLRELEEEKIKLTQYIKKRLKLLTKFETDIFKAIFQTDIQYDEGFQLLNLNRQISKVKHLIAVSTKHRQYKFERTFEEKIHIAKSVELESVVSQHVQLRQSGFNFLGLCPFHEEKTPSFTIFQRTNTWKCFGCGRGGDVITFVRLVKQCSFTEAISELSTI